MSDQTIEQERMFVSLRGIEDQIRKDHYLNVHFRAFELADAAWKEHIRQSAVPTARQHNAPKGAVLDE